MVAICSYKGQRCGPVEVAAMVQPAKKVPFWRIYVLYIHTGVLEVWRATPLVRGWIVATGELISQSKSISNLESLE